RDAIEGVPQRGQVLAARLGDDEPLALAIEELDAELQLQGLDLMADGALRHAQLLGGAREALVARGRLEGPERIERRKPARHRGALHEKNWGRLEKQCFAGNRHLLLLVCSSSRRPGRAAPVREPLNVATTIDRRSGAIRPRGACA